MSNASDKAIEMVTDLGAKLTEIAPVLWAKMVFLVQAESIAMLTVGALCLIVGTIGVICLIRSVKKQGPYDAPTVQTLVSLLFSVPVIPAAVLLLYPWNWVGAFAPEARLLARIMGAITGSNG